MRSLAVLVPLLLFATAAVSLAICSYDAPGVVSGPLRNTTLWGLAFGQVQLAAAALVFVRRHWALRVVSLIGTLIVWCSIVSPLTNASVPFDNALVLLTVAAVTVACGGALQFAGWQLALPNIPPAATPNSRQFSLATLLLLMAIVGVYAGLFSHTHLERKEFDAVAVVTVLCSLVGATLFVLTAEHRMWLLWAGLMSSLFIVRELGSPATVLDTALSIALAQSTFLAASMLVLSVGGVRLRRLPAATPSPMLHRPA